MIQKKSLKDAIQNPEIISVVGELLNPLNFGETISTSENDILFNKIPSISNGIHYVQGFNYLDPEKDWGTLIKMSSHAVFYPVYNNCILISRKQSQGWQKWDIYNAL